MTPQQIVGLAARLLSIWLGLTALQAIGIARALHAANAQGPSWLPYIVAVIYFAGALVLWFFPMALAHALVPRTKFEDKLNLPADKVVVVACVVLGLTVIVLRALPALSSYLAVAAFWIGSGATLSSLEISRHIDGVVAGIQALVGLLLVAKAHTIAQKIQG